MNLTRTCHICLSLILILVGRFSQICQASDYEHTEAIEQSNVAAARWEWREFSVLITIMLFLMLVILIKIAFRKIPYVAEYVPESLLLIIIGIIFGLIVKFGIRQGSFEQTVWSLTPTLFFNYLLPPIVLESAYSLYNRTFSEYLGVVLIFAVLGTIFNFLIIGFAMYGLFKAGAFGGPPIQFDLKGMLLFSSLIVAVDPVAVLAIFQDIGVELNLYYIVFGESLLNDAITVVLYDIMSAFAGSEQVTGHQLGVGVASFLTVSLGGLSIGVIVGVLSCLLTRIKSHLGAFILILLAYFSYIMADCVGWSGIIAMIGCGLVQAGYAFHNLDSKSVCTVHKLCKLVAEISESMIFLYIGIELLTEQLEWHTGFMLWSLVLCLIARALVILAITAVLNAVHVDGTKISFTEQIILIYGGLRGAVAFSLAILIQGKRLGQYGEYNRRLIITDTLFIILFTVGVMGLTMKPLVKLLKVRMQARYKLSLIDSLNNSVLDGTMTALEIITGVQGRNRVRDWILRMDERYVRRWLQREPQNHDQQLIKVYEKIALKLHYATMQPQRRVSLLAPIPESLTAALLNVERSTDLLEERFPDRIHATEGIASKTVKPGLHKTEAGAIASDSEVIQSMVSSRRASLIPYEKRQISFEDTLYNVMLKRTRALSHDLCGGEIPEGGGEHLIDELTSDSQLRSEQTV